MISNEKKSIDQSLHPLDYNGSATEYRLNNVKIFDFEEVFTKLNYIFSGYEPVLCEIIGPIDAEIGRKLRERLGYYIRTVLLQVFQNMDMNKYRYGMKVPITDEEDDRKRNDKPTVTAAIGDSAE